AAGGARARATPDGCPARAPPRRRARRGPPRAGCRGSSSGGTRGGTRRTPAPRRRSLREKRGARPRTPPWGRDCNRTAPDMRPWARPRGSQWGPGSAVGAAQRLAHGPEEAVEREGLFKELDPGLEQPEPGDGSFAGARDVEHLDRGAMNAEPRG